MIYFDGGGSVATGRIGNMLELAQPFSEESFPQTGLEVAEIEQCENCGEHIPVIGAPQICFRFVALF